MNLKTTLLFFSFLLLSTHSYANNFDESYDDCKELFDSRAEGTEATNRAIECYENKLSLNNLEKNQKSHFLTQLSYLLFFESENFLGSKKSQLLKALNYAKKASKLYGELFDFRVYRRLNDQEKTFLAKALYQFGTITGRYVELTGQLEAIKRMGDIKKSMNSAIRLKRKDIYHYGPARTLAMFYLKVPKIAGGSIKKAYTLIKSAMENTSNESGISSYPLNNLVYIDYLFKSGRPKTACKELELLKNLNKQDIEALQNGLVFESMDHVSDAVDMFERKC